MARMGDLAAALAPHLEADPHPTAAPGDRLAAVLAIVVDGDAPALVLTERAATMSRHAGEVSFPGGLAEPGDRDLRATALRETEEELGIAPSNVELLGALPPLHTFVSSILIVPFVGVLEPRPELRPNPGEIAEVLEYGLDALVEAETTVEWKRDRGVYRGYAYEMGDHTIWGATAMILHAFLELTGKEPA